MLPSAPVNGTATVDADVAAAELVPAASPGCDAAVVACEPPAAAPSLISGTSVFRFAPRLRSGESLKEGGGPVITLAFMDSDADVEPLPTGVNIDFHFSA